MGRVFLAEHGSSGRRVALKLLQPGIGSHPESVARFLAEAVVVNRIGHPHIVEVIEAGRTEQGEPYLAMELLEGETLGARLGRRGRLPFGQVVGIVDQVADALAASHRQGIVHRDLKPENVFLIERQGATDYVKVVDFGIAKLALDRDGPTVVRTESGVMVGTPYYAAPEQIRSDRTIDGRADIYALGVVIFQLLSGQLPFTGSAVAVLVHHLSTPLPALETGRLPGAIPAGLNAVLQRATAKDREARYRSMDELKAALHELAAAAITDGLAVPATAMVATATVPPPEVSPAATPAPEVAGTAPAPLAAAPGDTGLSVGATPVPERYSIVGEIARGGLGRISRAHDRRLGRPVALKELLKRHGDAEARFRREALLTARLEHPGIIPVHDAGNLPTGGPFYAMKLVEGRSLAQILDEKRSLPERLSLLPRLIDVCEAVAYAHAQRIIHRDLKPDNVLVGAFGETLVVDWGLARDLATPEAALADDAVVADPASSGSGPEDDLARSDSARVLTREGTVMGTPAYMPPEQAANSHSVDERADVYALGAMLYHLLTGRAPYEGNANLVLVSLLREAAVPVEQVEPRAPRDLVAIASKAMRHDPAERYPSAGELAADLRKFQTGQIVGAYRYTAGELLRRWIRRHAVGAAATVAVVVAAAAAFGVILRNQGRLIGELDEVKLEQARISLDRGPWRSLEILSGLSDRFSRHGAVRVLAADAVSRSIPQVVRGFDGNTFYSDHGELMGVALADGRVEIREVGTRRLLRELPSVRGKTWDAAIFSPDGRWIARLVDEQLEIFRSGDRAGPVRTVRPVVVYGSLLFSPDGTLITYASNGQRSLVEVATGRSVRWQSDPSHDVSCVFTPDGKTLLCSGWASRKLWAWDLSAGVERAPTGRVLDSSHPWAVAIAVSPDGRQVANSSDGEGLHIIEIATGARSTLESPTGSERYARNPLAAAYSRNGRYLALIDDALTLCLWDLSQGGCTLRQTGLGRGANGPLLAFSPGSRWLATQAERGAVWLHDLQSSSSRLVPARDSGASGLFLSDRWLISGGDPEDLHYDLQTAPPVLLGHQGPARGVVYTPDGRELVSGGADGKLLVWDRTGRLLRTLPGHQGAILNLIISPDGRRVAAADVEGQVRVVELASGRVQMLAGRPGRLAGALAFSPDSRLMASAGPGDQVLVRAVGGGPAPRAEVAAWPGHPTDLVDLAFSADGRWLAAGCRDGKLGLLDLGSGARQELRGHVGVVQAVRFSADSRLLASAAIDVIHLWPLADPRGPQAARRALNLKNGGHRSLAFSPDGTTLAGVGSTHIGLWDLITGQTRELVGHDGPIAHRHLFFSPDGGTLVTASFDTTARLWDVSGWRTSPHIESRVLRGHRARIGGLALSPDGTQVATASEDGTLRLWSDNLPRSGPALRTWLRDRKP
jgi:serine/threonine protein kinase/WD40 repeat protein